ncbi:lysine 5,6-aminomutase subunit alpha TIM-barrel domain-containing protein, partial [Candidatus Darwinibacter acetoxidans]
MVNQLLQIDQKQVERARQLAVQIARDIQREIDEVTTVSIERT